MENLECRGILQFHFPGLESPEIEVWVMESHGKVINVLRMNRQKKIKSGKNNGQVRKPVNSSTKIKTSMHFMRHNKGKYLK